jgi:hypothetical protein
MRRQVRERVRAEEVLGRRVARRLGRGRQPEARERVCTEEVLGRWAEDGRRFGRVGRGGRGVCADRAEVEEAGRAGRVGRGRGRRRVLIGVEEVGDEDGERARAGAGAHRAPGGRGRVGSERGWVLASVEPCGRRVEEGETERTDLGVARDSRHLCVTRLRSGPCWAPIGGECVDDGRRSARPRRKRRPQQPGIRSNVIRFRQPPPPAHTTALSASPS